MDTCPTEILFYISQLACTDAGLTYSSLSRVSKYLRDVVRPLQYHTVAVSGISHIVDISARLASKDVPPHLRRIRHLFISDQFDPNSVAKTIDVHAKVAIINILLLAAPTLESLTFHAGCPAASTSLIAGLFSIVFPKLTDLTVIGFYSFPHVPDSMPNLKSLHLRGNRNPHGLLHMGNLPVASPNLTHLRISGLCMAVSFAEELADALKNDSDEKERPESSNTFFSPRLPPKIRSLVIQPASATLGGTAGQFMMGDLKDMAMMHRLSELSRQSSPARVVKLDLSERETSHQSPFYSYDLAKRDWARRLNNTGDRVIE